MPTDYVLSGEFEESPLTGTINGATTTVNITILS